MLGDEIWQQCRPSLPDSFGVPSGGVETVALKRQQSHHKLADDPVYVSPDLLANLAVLVRGRLGSVMLLGLDLLPQGGSDELMLVDANYFPGYYGVSEVFDRVTRLAVARAAPRVPIEPSPPPLTVRLGPGGGGASLSSCSFLRVVAVPDLAMCLCTWLSVVEVGRLARCCRLLLRACDSLPVWTMLARRFVDRIDLLQGWSRRPRRLFLERVLPNGWRMPDGTEQRRMELHGGYVSACFAWPAQGWGLILRLSGCRGPFLGVGASCAGDSGRHSPWLPPLGFPCLVLGSGLWRAGSRLDAPPELIVPTPPVSPLLLGLRIDSMFRLHFFVDGVYLCSLALPERPISEWRFVIGASSGIAEITFDAPPFPPCSELNIL